MTTSFEVPRPQILMGVPSLETLAADPIWLAQLRTQVGLPKNLRHTSQTPWVLWACVVRRSPVPPQKPIWTWARSSHATYGQAFNAWVASRRKNTARVEANELGALIVDWSIVCAPKLWDQPLTVALPEGCSWCPRCRRPVVWRWIGRHHAVPGLADLQPTLRCPWCGIREETATPHQARAVRARLLSKQRKVAA